MADTDNASNWGCAIIVMGLVLFYTIPWHLDCDGSRAARRRWQQQQRQRAQEENPIQQKYASDRIQQEARRKAGIKDETYYNE